MAYQKERFEASIKKYIVEILTYDLKNPKLGFFTVSDVEVSKDFSYAKIYVSFYFEKDKIEGITILDKSKGFVRSELAHKLNSRKTPEISFHLDHGFDNEAKIEEALASVKKK